MRKLFSALTLYMTTVAVFGCVDIQEPAPEIGTPDDILLEFRMSVRAVMMTRSDTFHLSGHAIAVTGATIPVDPSRIKWSSLDSTRVYVDTLGRIFARSQTSSPVLITAKYKYGLTTKSDTVSVQVSTSEIHATSVRLVALDSTRVGPFPVVGFPRVRVDLYRGDTLVVRGAQVPVFVPSPVTVAFSAAGSGGSGPIYSVNNNKGFLGEFWVKVSLNLYGTEVGDSLLFTGDFAAAYSNVVGINQDGFGGVLVSEWPEDRRPWNMQRCGIVRVRNNTRDVSVDLVFSDSASDPNVCEPIADSTVKRIGGAKTMSLVTGGNVLNLPPGWQGWRRSGTVGEVSMYVRDAVTKQRLPISIQMKQWEEQE